MKVTLVTCGRCGKPRGVTHTCVARIGKREGHTRIRIRARVNCSTCGKPVGNPLRHVCTTTTDYRRRTAAAKRRATTEKRRARRKAAAKARRARAAARRKAARQVAASRPAAPRHDYQTCLEPDCQRQTCQAWREGRDEGFQEGHLAGVAACPREHP